jgi:retron-type reverse transcriptase
VLKAGIMVIREFEKTIKGCPQGSTLSPTLWDIVLDELYHELERRGHRYCRGADDFLILAFKSSACIFRSISACYSEILMAGYAVVSDPCN